MRSDDDHDVRADLRLAVTYIPAAVCLLKATLLTAILLTLDHLGVPATYVIVLLALALDRQDQVVKIVDINAVLAAIYGAHILARVRAASAHPIYMGLPVLSVVWVATALACLLEDVRPILRRPCPGPPVHLTLPASALLLAVCAFCAAENEPRVARLLRPLAFATLCVGWAYMTEAHSRRMLPARNTHYFLPVLCAQQYAAAAYLLAACAVGVCVLMHRDDDAAPAAAPPSPRAPLLPVDLEGMGEMERLLREARALRGARPAE